MFLSLAPSALVNIYWCAPEGLKMDSSAPIRQWRITRSTSTCLRSSLIAILSFWFSCSQYCLKSARHFQGHQKYRELDLGKLTASMEVIGKISIDSNWSQVRPSLSASWKCHPQPEIQIVCNVWAQLCNLYSPRVALIDASGSTEFRALCLGIALQVITDKWAAPTLALLGKAAFVSPLVVQV